MVRAIVFDVDGVLVRPMVFADVLESDYGLTLCDTAEFFQGPLKSCLVGKADLKTELVPFLSQWRWPHTVDEFVAQWFEADSTINSELMDFAEAARTGGVSCNVASTQERHRACYLANDMGLGSVFERLIFSCDVGCQKPDPRFYKTVTRELGVEPSDIFFLDDRVENVEGARVAGWQAERYSWGMDLRSIASQAGVDWDGDDNAEKYR